MCVCCMSVLLEVCHLVQPHTLSLCTYHQGSSHQGSVVVSMCNCCCSPPSPSSCRHPFNQSYMFLTDVSHHSPTSHSHLASASAEAIISCHGHSSHSSETYSVQLCSYCLYILILVYLLTNWSSLILYLIMFFSFSPVFVIFYNTLSRRFPSLIVLLYIFLTSHRYVSKCTVSRFFHQCANWWIKSQQFFTLCQYVTGYCQQGMTFCQKVSAFHRDCHMVIKHLQYIQRTRMLL